MKKFFSILLCAALVFPSQASAAYVFNPFTKKLDATGSGTINAATAGYCAVYSAATGISGYSNCIFDEATGRLSVTEILTGGSAANFWIGGEDDGGGGLADWFSIGYGTTFGTTRFVKIIYSTATALLTFSNNGGSSSLQIDNSYTSSGSTDETSCIELQHGTTTAGKLCALKEEDFTSSGNRSAGIGLYVIKDGTVSRVGYVAASGNWIIGTGSTEDGKLNVDGSVVVNGADQSNTNLGLIVNKSQGATALSAFQIMGAIDPYAAYFDPTTEYVGLGTNAPAAKLHVVGEARITGVSGDGNGKAVCIKSDGNLGTCSDVVSVSGTCTCG